MAQRARVAKRTFYSRFGDKESLFAAVLHRVVERLRPPGNIPLYDGDDHEEVLRRLARLMLRAALNPNALALSRLLLAESSRFPELTAVVAREGASAEVARGIAQILERATKVGRLKVEDPVFAAEHFIQMVIGQPQRRAHGLGPRLSEAELDRWASRTVDLFLNGCRGQPSED